MSFAPESNQKPEKVQPPRLVVFGAVPFIIEPTHNGRPDSVETESQLAARNLADAQESTRQARLGRIATELGAALSAVPDIIDPQPAPSHPHAA